MTALNKQALRQTAEKAQEHGVFNMDIHSQTVLALLDENLQLQRDKDSLEAAAITMRDDMREAREKLEAAEKRIAEQSAIVAAAERLVRCKGRYHSEQNYRALAALFGVTTPDLPPLEHENVHFADAAEMEIAALRQHIAELEARTVTLPPLNDDLIAILGRPNFTCSHLAELMRKSGDEIRRKSEHEQAAVIHWFLGIYLEHGDKWEGIAKADIQSRVAAAGIGVKGE